MTTSEYQGPDNWYAYETWHRCETCGLINSDSVTGMNVCVCPDWLEEVEEELETNS